VLVDNLISRIYLYFEILFSHKTA